MASLLTSQNDEATAANVNTPRHRPRNHHTCRMLGSEKWTGGSGWLVQIPHPRQHPQPAESSRRGRGQVNLAATPPHTHNQSINHRICKVEPTEHPASNHDCVSGGRGCFHMRDDSTSQRHCSLIAAATPLTYPPPQQPRTSKDSLNAAPDRVPQLWHCNQSDGDSGQLHYGGGWRGGWWQALQSIAAIWHKQTMARAGCGSLTPPNNAPMMRS